MIAHAEIREGRCSCDPVPGQEVACAISAWPDLGEIYSAEVQDFLQKAISRL